MRLLVITALCLLAARAVAFDDGRVDFLLRVNGLTIPYSDFAIYALPEETIDVDVVGARQDTSMRGEALRTEQLGGGRWRLHAPAKHGLYPVTVTSGEDTMRLNVFVMIPADRVDGEKLNGFRIGSYPARPLRGDPAYLPPRGYIELTEANADTRLSPHFTLSQFPAKQAGGFPKYLVLRETLLLKLEMLLEEVNRRGVTADSFVIMSGYRTPYYNASIGNVPYSRHVYGGAADIYVDEAPRDGVMDDINGDGKVDYRDAQRLYNWANALFARPENRHVAGGLGVYRRNPAHGPFLHVDARGQRARWGLIPQGDSD